MDLSRLMCQWLLMASSKHRDARDTHHTVSAGILDALGRGFLIATAGVMAGAIFGTANLAAIGLWTIGVAAASGVACMIGSALVRNAACDRCEKNVSGSPRAATVRMVAAARPVVDADKDVEPEDHRARRRVISRRQSAHGTSRSV
jgi:hypothetical protein